MSRLVLDTSAILAAFFSEPGAEVVRDRGAGGVLSAVSYSEALAKLHDRGAPLPEAERMFASLHLTLVPFDQDQAVLAASFRAATRQLGLSFADRACLACASTLRLPALTADREWSALAVGVEVVLIRSGTAAASGGPRGTPAGGS